MTTYNTCGTYTVFTPSSTASINALLEGFKWGGAVGSGTTVTYSFPTTSSYWQTGYGQGEPAHLTALNASAQQGIQLALQAWSSVANIAFQLVADNASVVGDIRVAFTSAASMSGGTYAYTYVITGGYSPSAASQGDLWVNANQPVAAGSDFSLGACGYNTLIHELGHAMGFDHPFGSDATIPDPGLTSAQNTYKYTVMAYCDAPGHWDYGTCSYYPTTPMLLDIAAAQYLYGANMSYNSGNTTYTYNQGSNYYETIWDGGGNDTIVYNSTVGGVIDLRAGNFSQLGNPITLSDGTIQYDNVAIAYGVVIENATGGSGNDLIYGNGVNNVILGGAGNDTLYGMGGNDTVNGGDGNDTLFGNIGNDILSGDAGADTMYGGAGNDTYYVDNAGDVATENSGEGTDTVISSITYTLGANVENLTLSGSSAINGTGNALDNIITGNSAADTLAGGAGNDTYYVSNTGTVIVENSGEGTDTVISSVTYTLGANVENLTLSGSSAINGTGNALDNVITGNSAVNTLTGGAGNDTYYVSNAGAVVVENSGEGTDTIISSVTYTLGANVENLTLSGSSAIDGTGNELDNTITGNSAANYIIGWAGNDTINGGAGNDILYGFGGNDTVNGGDGNDAEWGNIGDDTVNGDAGNDALYGMGGNDVVNGGDGDDMVLGNIGDDIVSGGNGNDLLYGNPGNDTLTGGAGNDTFVFNAPLDAATNVDTITDFTVGADILAMDDAIFTMLTVGALAANEFAAGAGFTTGQSATDYFVYNTSTGDLYYDADGSGAGSSTLVAHLSSGLSLSSSDFQVV